MLKFDILYELIIIVGFFFSKVKVFVESIMEGWKERVNYRIGVL